MTRYELQSKISEILGMKVTCRTRYAKTQVGECWGTFVALYGSFERPSHLEPECILKNTNGSLAYAVNNKEMIQKLQDASLNAFRVFRGAKGNTMFEIVIEVQSYYNHMGDPNVRGFDFREKPYITEKEIGGSYKYYRFKLVNSF